MPPKKSAAAASTIAPPSIVGNETDAAVLEVLARCEGPLALSASVSFKFVLILKRWAAAVRSRCVRATREDDLAKEGAEAKGKKKKKPKGPSASTLLKDRLALHGLHMLVIDSDGNCQFRAVSQQLYGSQAHHMFVRSQAVAYMNERKEEFACFFPGSAFERYLTKMGRDREWGDELTLRAICNALGVVVHVITSNDDNWYLKYEPDEQRTAKQIFLGYVAPAHYNAFELAVPTRTSKRAAPEASGDAKRSKPE